MRIELWRDRGSELFRTRPVPIGQCRTGTTAGWSIRARRLAHERRAGFTDRITPRPASLQDQHWAGTFWEYLDICRENPGVVRRTPTLYDAIMSYGCDRYRLFKRSASAITSSPIPSTTAPTGSSAWTSPSCSSSTSSAPAAEGYGTDKRILLLHGPVGSSKSTIARLLKKGIEAYSRTTDGTLYTFSWMLNEHCEASPEPDSPPSGQDKHHDALTNTPAPCTKSRSSLSREKHATT